MKNINKTAIVASLGWLAYNTIFASTILAWTKATPVMWLWAIFPVIVVTIFMIAVTLGSQNKDKE